MSLCRSFTRTYTHTERERRITYVLKGKREIAFILIIVSFFLYRKAAQNLMKQVHKREASEGHWASFGMPPQPPGEKEKCKEKCKEKGKQSVKKCGSGGGGGLERTTTIQ